MAGRVLARLQSDESRFGMRDEVEGTLEAARFNRLEEREEVVSPAVRLSPDTPDTLMAMPRTSFSRSVCDEALANLIQAW